MSVRLATFADLESIARILAAAFHDEELNAYFYPYRDKFPEDYVRSWYHTTLEKWWGYDNVWIVSYEITKSESDLSKSNGARVQQTITGAAQWSRVGTRPGEMAGLHGPLDPRHYLAPTLTLYHSAHRRMFPNRSVGCPTPDDPQPLRKWEFEKVIWSFCERYYTEPSYRKRRWQLDILGVDPKYQKHGFGSALIAWGQQRARDEEFPAVVIMAKGLEGFYGRQGFEILVGYANADDVIIEEKDSSGKMVRRTIANPLKQRNIGGGGIAWTRTENDG